MADTGGMASGQNPAVIKKIKDLGELAVIVDAHRSKGQSIVQCHGVFDLLHPGHIRHLAEGKRQGDILVVTITADKHVNKGPGRPAFTQELRAETLASLESVDYVAVSETTSAIEAIKLLRPDVFVKGSDYVDPDEDVTGNIVEEADTVAAVGGRIHFTTGITFSSSSLINQNFLPFPRETEDWLKEFRQRRSEDEIFGAFNAITPLNIMVLGEAIIDEYIFCSGLGRSSKDPVLAFQRQSMESVVGGSLAVANHLGDFCAQVELVALQGEIDSHEDMIRRSLHPNVTWRPVIHQNAPTIRKRRFVDEYTGSKLFELYYMDDGPLDPETEAAAMKTIEKGLEKADVVIIADYGHGMMSQALVDIVTEKAKFLVVNTQANAGNRGLNTISKYTRADYVCLAGNEMEFETRMRHAGVKEKLAALADCIDCPRFTVTLGRSGTVHHEKDGIMLEAPALAPKVVDRVGAGDAVLAITGALVAVGTPWDIVALIGNAAGAEMVAELGNRQSLSKAGFFKHITALLK